MRLVFIITIITAGLVQILTSAFAIAFAQIVTAVVIGIVALFALIVFILIRRGSRGERS